MQFTVYTRRGDSHGATIAGLIRALLSSRLVPGHVQLVDDPELLRMNHISAVPTVLLDGSYISCGHVPTRAELETAIDRRQQALALSRSVFENRGESRSWRR